MMPEKITIQKLASELRRAFAEGDEESGDAFIKQSIARYGVEFAKAAFDLWAERTNADYAEAMKEHARHRAESDAAMKIFEGLPKDITFEEACKIKAAQGDAVAQRFLRQLTSREARLFNALADAAVDLHSGWRKVGNGEYEKLADDAPEAPELVEWLYKNHPKTAREIEAIISAEFDGKTDNQK